MLRNNCFITSFRSHTQYKLTWKMPVSTFGKSPRQLEESYSRCDTAGQKSPRSCLYPFHLFLCSLFYCVTPLPFQTSWSLYSPSDCLFVLTAHLHLVILASSCALSVLPCPSVPVRCTLESVFWASFQWALFLTLCLWTMPRPILS